MKKKITLLIVPVILAALLYVAGWGAYRAMSLRQQRVDARWANVETQHQRRAGLIPNLVLVVEERAVRERAVLDSVMEIRGRAAQIQLRVDAFVPDAVQQYSAVQGELSVALHRLAQVSGAYPGLVSDPVFRDLQVQLEDAENRIWAERRRFNEIAQIYNDFTQQFPQVIWAKVLGFKPAACFPMEEMPGRVPPAAEE